jgi:hypothetical protein
VIFASHGEEATVVDDGDKSSGLAVLAGHFVSLSLFSIAPCDVFSIAHFRRSRQHFHKTFFLACRRKRKPPEAYALRGVSGLAKG